MIVLLARDGFASVPLPLQCLWAAYPVFKIINGGEGIQFSDGTQMPFKDTSGRNLENDFYDIVENTTSLEQQFWIPYIKGFPVDHKGNAYVTVPAQNQDPGRIRYEPFFKKIYGDSESIVRAQLVTVKWSLDSTKIPFHPKFYAAASLQAVAEELVNLVHHHPEFAKFVVSPLGGSFKWRKIAGSQNLSVHSFAVALDINTKYSDYWQWEESSGIMTAPPYKNQIPWQIVSVFEKHGFIWGGKWDHFDSMHFEYRPELLLSKEECRAKFKRNYFRGNQ